MVPVLLWLLQVRVFDEATKKSVYAKQTKAAATSSKSNCLLCAVGPDANKSKIWKLAEMDADRLCLYPEFRFGMSMIL